MSGAVAGARTRCRSALGGRATFLYALVREFAVWRNTEVTVRSTASERRGRCTTSSSRTAAGTPAACNLAPDASPDDGLFDVILIGDVTKLDFVTTAPKLYSGKTSRTRRSRSLRGATVSVDAAEPLPIELEGEPVGTTPVRFDVCRARCASAPRPGNGSGRR